MSEFSMPSHLFLACFLLFEIVIILQLAQGESSSQSSCPKQFTCGNITKVSFPFSNVSRPECGLYTLDCNATPYPTITLGQHKYGVVFIKGDLMLLFDPLLEKYLRERSCNVFHTGISFPSSASISFDFVPKTMFYKCNSSSNVSLQKKIGHYFHGYRSYNSCQNFSLYYTQMDNDTLPTATSLPAECSVIYLPFNFNRSSSAINLFENLNSLILIQWKVSEVCTKCHYNEGQCLTDTHNNFQCLADAGKKKRPMLILIITVASVVGVTMLMTTLMCLWRNFLYQIFMNFLKTENERNIEVFLRNNGSFSPKRYTYLEVKRITNSFRDKLGQGGYGFVYKGKLANGAFVAVKLLKELKGSGEEFINEVASISRTSHVNIVTLLGFCVEGDKRALLYEFMPYGSLESFIYDGKLTGDRQLEWLTLYKITIGIARGLEYLHRGCRTKILHFDIKPHNILLDEDFCPKISDFGLAKLHTAKESFVSITGVRGTIGYVAPEVACRNFGAVSHKADVYSYGMMVLEIVSGRKNVEHDVDRNSEIYFPHWIYRQIELDKELGLKGIMNELDKEYARKMVMVGLWCIHFDPSIRPSISMVLEMLENSADLLPIPPKPYLYSSTPTEANSSTIH
ncbi:PREDICTED: LEAF RUST 10 DISEASE-RESISTANCE LOCUS RECEPTOR-LIKE PROTEIN KINASE-like 2.4 [Ipomoea nil]|uniref:LEAF RUST 10 DISEASE-RESISTANCE LOCUS RECEPTOR-LIKE PROTEIN KINASE-like 2.4 n=1 Tax=Ipomoea nil TaxID=35883 RepID=UPI0009012278|nr:PREDICTED: LEAF RUST 10 DISEASE-RESISTANCE LOCUS RECEPTOR-LIKE PROTEIN KINASE-like 2.4 [Ipomoea nil]